MIVSRSLLFVGRSLNPTVVVLKLYGQLGYGFPVLCLNPTVVVLKPWRNQGGAARLEGSQSNRSGFETMSQVFRVFPVMRSQSNRSGFETVDAQCAQSDQSGLNPTVVVLKQRT